MLHTFPGFDRIGEENAFAVLARAGELAAQGKDVINLGIGQPDFPTPGNIAEAAIKAIRDGHHGYTPATGIPELRAAVAADLDRRFGAEVSPNNVLIVPGGKVTMFATILMLGEPGAEYRVAGNQRVRGTLQPPRIKGAPVAFECSLFSAVVTGPKQTIAIGRIEAIHVDDAMLIDAERGHVDNAALDLIARLHGSGWYVKGGERFKIDRPAPIADGDT